MALSAELENIVKLPKLSKADSAAAAAEILAEYQTIATRLRAVSDNPRVLKMALRVWRIYREKYNNAICSTFPRADLLTMDLEDFPDEPCINLDGKINIP